MRRGMSTSAPQGEAPSRNHVTEDSGQRKSSPSLGQLSPTGSLPDESPTSALFGKAKRGYSVDDGRTSSSQSTLNLVNCILGAGVLGYPFCFRSCGLLLGTLLMLVSIAASRFSYDLMLYCTQISRKRTYEELAEQAVGKLGKQIVQLCTAALNLGCIVAYLNILADVFSAVAGTIIPPGAEPSRNAYITGVSLFGALPVALWVRDHATLATFMMASVGFVILFAVIVVIFALAPHPATAAAMHSVAMWQPEGLLVAFPVIVFSFTAHPYYLGIFNNLHGATFARMGRVTNLAMGLSAILYWVVGVFGYMTFRNRTAGDLLRNFGAANVESLRGAYERAIKLCYGLSILGSVPLVILPFYSIMAPLIGYTVDGGLRDGTKLMKRAGSGPDLDAEELARQGGSYNGTAGGTAVARCSSGKLARTTSHEVDVVDLKLHADRDSGQGEELEFGKHALVVILVLGTSLATAIWVPNIEFIFGLTGATASVLLSYIIPAIAFIKLMDNNPELLGGGNFKVIPDVVKSQWLWRKRKAIGLLCFGIVSGITCTDAILGAVKQEAAVVHLAQQLVAHEVVVAETAKVQQKARAAVTAMSAVELAAKELGQANVSASGTYTKLQQAAAQLDTIAAVNGSTGGDGGKSSQVWGIKSFMKEHKQHAAETKVFKAVQLALTDIKDEVRRTAAGVSSVIAQLDAAIAQLNNGEGVGAAAGNATVACDGSPCPAPPSPSAAPAAVSTGSSARDRANDLAMELGKALGAFSDVAGNVTAGKSLSQVRSTAMSTLVALNQTAAVLEHVSQAVEAAKKSNKHDDEIKKTAAVAMRLALNATATSALAMQLTGEALQRSATEEASELLTMLVKVSHDLEKTSQKGKFAKTKRIETNTTATATATMSTTAGAASTSDTKAIAGGTIGVSTGSSAGSASGASGGVSGAVVGAATPVGSTSDTSATQGGVQNATAPAKGTGVEAPGATGSGDRAAEAAGQLEQVIKDLNSKIAAASGSADTASAAAAAAAASGGSITSKGTVVGTDTTAATGVTGLNAASTSAGGSTDKTSTSGSKTSDSKTSSSSGNSGTSTAAATASLLPNNSSSTGGDLSSGLNVSGIAAALQDAVAVTKVKQDEALQEIQDSLTNTNAKVAERVVDILKDISETKKEASVKSNKAGGTMSGGTGFSMEATLTGGGGEAAAAIAASGFITTGATGSSNGESSSSTTAGTESTVTSGNTLEEAFLGLVHKITDTSEKAADVEGPVVKVDSEGHLVQEGGDVVDGVVDGVVGPTVTDAEMQHAAGTAAKATNSDSNTSDDASNEAGLKQHRKLGLGWAAGG